jgi:hypothetical protein
MGATGVGVCESGNEFSWSMSHAWRNQLRVDFSAQKRSVTTHIHTQRFTSGRIVV